MRPDARSALSAPRCCAIIRRILEREPPGVRAPQSVATNGRDNLRVARCPRPPVDAGDGFGSAGAVRGRAWTTTTQAPPEGDRPRDLVDRNFTATCPNQLWVADFTY